MARSRNGRGSKGGPQERLENPPPAHYVLQLFITGATPNSSRAVANIKRICERHFKGCYRLEIVDLYRQPERAAGEQILAAPTLLKHEPLPARRLIGDMSNEERVLAGLRGSAAPLGAADA